MTLSGSRRTDQQREVIANYYVNRRQTLKRLGLIPRPMGSKFDEEKVGSIVQALK
jgi:hypothetical protein